MDLSKSYDFFKPEAVTQRIHIIGCGSVGSTVAELLARIGLTNITLYDFDRVEPHNIVNQMFTERQVGMEKVDATLELMNAINPECANSVTLMRAGYTKQKLAGYVFLCVDNIDLRRRIVEENKHNIFIKAMFDFRTRLTDAQHYAADWSDEKMVEALLNSMNFSHEEAAEETPVSACHVTLAVPTTVRMICDIGVGNFMNFVRGRNLKKLVLCDAFSPSVDAF